MRIKEFELKYLKKKTETRRLFLHQVLKKNKKLTSNMQEFHGSPITEEQIADNLCEMYKHLSSKVHEFVPLIQEELERSGLNAATLFESNWSHF